MPHVSVLTALAPRPGGRLDEIHAALKAAAADWEWVIQVDGPQAPPVPDDPRIRVAVNGRPLGIALTRNRALARVRAPLILNADSDDVPVPGALDVLARAFDDPEVGMAFGDWVEVWPDGTTWTPEITFEPGVVAAGAITAAYDADGWMPMHLAGAMWRTDAVLAAGGWTAISGGADIGLMLGVDAQWASHYTATPTFTYHHHADQATAAQEWHALFELDRELLRRRSAALRRTPPATRPASPTS